MANLNKVHESCLPGNGEERRKLIEDIKRVAAEIEYTGYRDTSILAKELDRQEIRPLRHNYACYHGYHQRSRSKWYDKTKGAETPAGKLRGFIRKHIPELLQQEPNLSIESVPRVQQSGCLCSKCDVNRKGSCKILHSPGALLDNQAVSKGHVSNESARQQTTGKAPNINGWTVRQDKKGFYRAYKRINGKVRSVYIGKSLDGAVEKLQAANEEWP
jgi:hypothetical protein